MEAFELNAQARTATGRTENRRLRKSGRIPAIIYGGNGDPVMFSLDHDDLSHHLENEAFFSHIIKIKIDGEAEEAVLRDLQRHPARPFIEHADFLRVVAGEPLRMSVPLHFVGEEESPGIVDEGGVMQHNLNELIIECLPRHLPEYLEVDCTKLNLNDSVHMSELVLPNGVQLVDLMGDEEEQNDLTVVSVQVPRAAIELEAEDEAEADAEADAGAADDTAADDAADDDEQGEDDDS